MPEAIRIGRIMEEHGYGFYEEPCQFDDLWETKEVADALTIPVAGGEQEYQHAPLAVDDRATAAWTSCSPTCTTAAASSAPRGRPHGRGGAACTVVPHMSGGGLGYLDVVHFASFTPNIGPFMEFKGNADLPVHCPTSSLKVEKGIVRCPEPQEYHRQTSRRRASGARRLASLVRDQQTRRLLVHADIDFAAGIDSR